MTMAYVDFKKIMIAMSPVTNFANSMSILESFNVACRLIQGNAHVMPQIFPPMSMRRAIANIYITPSSLKVAKFGKSKRLETSLMSQGILAAATAHI